MFCAEEIFDDELLIINGDVVFHSELIDSMLNQPGDIIVGNVQTDGSDLDYSGVIKLSKKGVKIISTLWHDADQGKLKGMSLLHFIKNIVAKTEEVNYPILQGSCAKVDANLNFARFFMGSKSQTLKRLRPVIKHGSILKQVVFSVTEWEEDNNEILKKIDQTLPDTKLIVRSSSQREDGFDNSLAGHFKSILEIPANQRTVLRTAINEVMSGFGHQSNNSQDVVFCPTIPRKYFYQWRYFD